MSRFEEIYYEAKGDDWFKKFTVFCRVALAASFLPAGYIKIIGERFARGLPSNNPLGHYFEALLLTDYYYTFIGVVQIVVAILLLIPRTALLGALMYFAIIVNICVLTYATRFDGTRLNTLLVLASLFLLVWDYDRLKYLLPFKQTPVAPMLIRKPLGKRLRVIFFGGSFAVLVFIVVGTTYLFEIWPGNSEAECRNQCPDRKNPTACQVFCDCIYKKGQSLKSSLATFDKLKDNPKPNAK